MGDTKVALTNTTNKKIRSFFSATIRFVLKIKEDPKTIGTFIINFFKNLYNLEDLEWCPINEIRLGGFRELLV